MVLAVESTPTSGVDLAEHDLLDFVIEGQHTSASDTTEDVSTSTLEKGFGTLLSNDLGTGIEHRLVVNRSTGSHHHTTTDCIQWVRCQTSTNSNTPSKTERGKEGTLEGANEDDGLCGALQDVRCQTKNKRYTLSES